jgi:hypothetical protein
VVCIRGGGHDDWVVVPRWRSEASCLRVLLTAATFVFPPRGAALAATRWAMSEAATTAAPAFAAAAADLFCALPSAVVYFAVAVPAAMASICEAGNGRALRAHQVNLKQMECAKSTRVEEVRESVRRASLLLRCIHQV